MARWRADSAGCGQDVLNGGMWPIEQLADLVQGIALAPAIPHHRLLCFGVAEVVASWPALLAPGAVIVLHRPVEFTLQSRHLQAADERHQMGRYQTRRWTTSQAG